VIEGFLFERARSDKRKEANKLQRAPMALKQGIYKTAKGNTIVMAEDGRNLYALYNDQKFGKREKWPAKYKDYQEFAKSQGMVRVEDWNGVFF
jgi:hypothetical protein